MNTRRLRARVPNRLRWRRQPDRSRARHVRASGGEAGAFFTSLDTPSATPATAGLTTQTWQSFEQLFVELATAMSLHGTGAFQPARTFATYDMASVTDIFGGPPLLAPPGVYP